VRQINTTGKTRMAHMRVVMCGSGGATRSAVVLAKARTHHPRKLFGEEPSYIRRAHFGDHAVWVLAFARTTVDLLLALFLPFPLPPFTHKRDERRERGRELATAGVI
jgi:hypothetical protein